MRIRSCAREPPIEFARAMESSSLNLRHASRDRVAKRFSDFNIVGQRHDKRCIAGVFKLSALGHEPSGIDEHPRRSALVKALPFEITAVLGDGNEQLSNLHL